MAPSKGFSYLTLVFIAYGFYILLGLSWLVVSLLNNHNLNPYAVFLVVIFGAQCYYKHVLTNLILGVMALLFSIYMFLFAMNGAVAASRSGGLTLFDQSMVAMTVCSILFSVILIFSFLKLNFRK